MNERITEQEKEKIDDYDRLKLEYTRLHEDYRRLLAQKEKQSSIPVVMQAKPEKFFCDFAKEKANGKRCSSQCKYCEDLQEF